MEGILSRLWFTFWTFLGLFFCVGCVGPTTPFGALNSVKSVEESREPASIQESANAESIQSRKASYKIQFHPEKQVLHDKFDFSIEVKSDRPFTDDVKLQISYNNLDVLEAFKRNTVLHRSSDNKTLIYVFKDLRLKILDMNAIRVQVIDKKGRGLATEFYKEPDCSIFKSNQLAHLGEFHAPEEFIGLIERVSKEHQTNPSFLAGVVAQESGFDPKAVSWAKAIGLTQITPLAEEQVIHSVQDWPRYPGINTLSYVSLKTKIFTGEIDEITEWRLDPEKSLEGGLTYFSYLKKYWELDTNQKLIDDIGGDKERLMSDLILASYNSGAARVKRALQDYRHKWKRHESLKEAVHYLKRVNSYCFHYTKKEVQDDNET